MSKFNVAAINCCTEVEGPYKRLAIWFQGCSIGCRGCCNPEYQALSPRHIMTLDALLSAIREAKERYGIEGVTYLGGEPTLQQALPELTAGILAMGLGVISFTGYLYEQVKERLAGCDMVIDGAYEQERPDTVRRLLGSENQRILCVSDRYTGCLDWFFSSDTKGMEIHMGHTVFANGDPM